MHPSGGPISVATATVSDELDEARRFFQFLEHEAAAAGEMPHLAMLLRWVIGRPEPNHESLVSACTPSYGTTPFCFCDLPAKRALEIESCLNAMQERLTGGYAAAP
jgi:hypothetical protein